MRKYRIAVFFAAAAAFVSLVPACGKSNPTVRTDVFNQARDHLNLGVSEYSKGNFTTARLFLNQAMSESCSIDNIPLQVRVLLSLGELELAQGSLTDASNHIFSAWVLADMSDTPPDKFNLYATTGKYYAKISNYTEAIKSYELAVRSVGDPARQAIIYNNLGNVYRRMSQFDRAMNYLSRAVRINASKKIYDQLAGNHFNIGELYLQQSQTAKAYNEYLLALKYDKISESSVGIIEDLKRLAQCAYTLGKKEAALGFLDRAMNVAANIRLDRQVAAIKDMIAKYSAGN